jgi:hypothetical protein
MLLLMMLKLCRRKEVYVVYSIRILEYHVFLDPGNRPIDCSYPNNNFRLFCSRRRSR